MAIEGLLDRSHLLRPAGFQFFANRALQVANSKSPSKDHRWNQIVRKRVLYVDVGKKESGAQ
jgi:hypothetical protein